MIGALVVSAVVSLQVGLDVPTITVEVGSTEVVTDVGALEFLDLRVVNGGDSATGDLVGHLVVVEPGSEGSADAEDWTERLSRPIPSLHPGDSVELDWDVKPIMSGEFVVMVAVVPAAGAGAPATSPVVRFSVAQPDRLVDGPVVPVAVVVPVVLGVGLMWSSRAERRRIADLSARF